MSSYLEDLTNCHASVYIVYIYNIRKVKDGIRMPKPPRSNRPNKPNPPRPNILRHKINNPSNAPLPQLLTDQPINVQINKIKNSQEGLT